MTAGPNRWEARKRDQKVARFVAEFCRVARAAGSDPDRPDVAEQIAQGIQGAEDGDWKRLAEQLGEPRTPSPTSRGLILAHFQMIANRPFSKGDWETQEFGRERFVFAGLCAGDHKYAVEAVNNGGGFGWSLDIDGQFVRGGYTRGADVRRAFADAKDAAEARFAEQQQQGA